MIVRQDDPVQADVILVDPYILLDSPEQQSAGVFQRIVQVWGRSDRPVVWHVYISSRDTGGNWTGRGIKSDGCRLFLLSGGLPGSLFDPPGMRI